jgi:flagellar L-ring protein FlgH
MQRQFLFTLLAALALTSSATAQSRPGSIYDVNAGGVSLVAHKIAHRPGDLITVVINEAQNVTNQEASDFSKSTNLDYEMNKMEIFDNLFETLPSIGATSSDGFTGSATYTKAGAFNARLTAIVVDVLPTGNMVVEGRREVRIDNETKIIEFRGILRRWDISPMNTIDSELVAEAVVTYSGAGPMTKATNRQGLGGMFHDAIAWIWPF